MKPIVTLLATVCATAATAEDFDTALRHYFETEIVEWTKDPRLAAAIRAQNEVTGGYDQARIDELDATWRAEIGRAETPLITSVVETPLSGLLREFVTGSNGAITEIFVMDARGLNVAASAPTSDYWQGDEAKHSETFGRGAGALHIAEVEFDDSTQSYQGQVSVTISDPASNAPLGAITFGLDPEALM